MTISVPKKGKKFWEIVERGCGYEADTFNGDGDCIHEYNWECDNCPCTVNQQRENKI